MSGISLVYDAGGSLVHIDAVDDPATPGYDPKVTDYVTGPMGTLARISNGTVTYLHPDHLGSAQSGTDSSGGISWREQYTPFGEELQSPAANDNLGGFTGHIRDKATGLNYMQARYYDPVIGRFLSVDPVGFLETGEVGQFNRYAYTWNNPINANDPDGSLPVFVVPLAIFIAKEIAAEGASRATRGATDFLSVRRIGARVAKAGRRKLARHRAKQVRKNAAEGSRFEKAVGDQNNLTPNTETFDTSVQRTKPDFKDGADLADAKSVKSLSNTQQMKAQRDLAESNGGTHTVYVNADKDPTISGPMERSSTVIIRCTAAGTPC